MQGEPICLKIHEALVYMEKQNDSYWKFMIPE